MPSRSSTPNASVVPIVATSATMRRPWSSASRATASSRSTRMSFSRWVGTRNDALLAEPEPAGDVQAAVVALRGGQDHAAARHAVVHRVRERLFDAELRAVEHRPGPAEREHAARPRRVVPDEPRHHGHDRRLGQHEAIRRIVGDQIRIVDGRQQRPDDAGNRRRRNDVDLRPRMPPNRHAFELAD